ncbi:MAG: hypothetical protein ACKPGI_10015 [Verrucomicrobiota bacterium]
MPSLATPSVPLISAEPTPVGVALSTPWGDEATPSPWTWQPILPELLRQPQTDDLAD